MREKTTRLCLIRHGETDWNAQLRIQGHRDLPLNANGEAQAQALAKALAGERFDAIFCSDLLRARETAAPLSRVSGLAVQIEPALRERNFGCCEGMTIDEISAKWPQLAVALASRPPDFVLPDGESLRQHQDRMVACIARLARDCAGQCLAIVSHGGSLEMIYRRARGIPLERPRDFSLPNASINWLTISGDDWNFDSWGETAHLGEIPIAAVVTRI